MLTIWTPAGFRGPGLGLAVFLGLLLLPLLLGGLLGWLLGAGRLRLFRRARGLGRVGTGFSCLLAGRGWVR